MLASITPLGERGRQSRWGVTVTAFAAAATLAGGLGGAALGVLGGVSLNGLLGAHGRLLVLAGGLALAVALELLPAPVPGPRRQVDERWLHDFRGWVYGAGFGAQLGLGLTTVVTSAATYAAVLAALLSGSVAAGAVILGAYGALRGLTPILAAGVRDPARLVALHVALERWRRPVARLTPALLGVLLALCLGALA